MKPKPPHHIDWPDAAGRHEGIAPIQPRRRSVPQRYARYSRAELLKRIEELETKVDRLAGELGYEKTKWLEDLPLQRRRQA